MKQIRILMGFKPVTERVSKVNFARKIILI